MPKRPHPFDDDISRQFKIHVGEKELSNGVIKNTKMKQIHEKTTDRLFEGVNVWYKSLSNMKKPDNSKILTEQNQIENSLCSNGHYAKTVNMNHCDYCDKSVCFSCLRECKSCKNFYCMRCCMEEFDNSIGESWLCLSCM